jgi:hypothetical protein
MAEEVAIGATGERAKLRNPVAVALLPIVTLGIYSIVWYYKINKELAAIGRDRGKSEELGDNPVNSVLAVTVGAIVIVPAIISIVHTFKRIQAAQRLAGAEPLNGTVGVILALFTGPIFYAYEQSGLNNALQALGTAAAPAAAAVAA